MKRIVSILALATVVASCSNNNKEAAMKAQQATIDSMKLEIAKKHLIDSMNEMAALRYTVPPATVATEQTVASTKPQVKYRTRTRTVYVNRPTSNGYTGYAPVEEPKKKGWSAKAKGAVIGAGAGALTGALISKQKGKGAILGGLLGAGAGLGTGAIIDHKKGR